MKRVRTELNLPQTTIGTTSTVVIYDYYPSEDVKNMDKNSLEWYSIDKAYFETSIHAEELPGLLVCHHLVKLLDIAAEKGAILKPITIVPYTNPVGLNQMLLGKHMGRFSYFTGSNFNRNWMDVTETVAKNLEGKLTHDRLLNTAMIRRALYDELSQQFSSNKPELAWRAQLLKRSCTSSITIDMHCDLEAMLHLYTQEQLWPTLADLTASIGSGCNILTASSGGNMHEASSEPFVKLRKQFPDYPIDLACQAATIELRGGALVYDDIALLDATNLYQFLVRRGYVSDESVLPLSADLLASQVASPLSGADMVHAHVPGVLTWKVKVGDRVEKGQLLGEIVNIEDVDAPRTPILAGTSGLIWGMDHQKLAVPGDVILYIAGNSELEWRKGRLMTD
jgi:predicted deacylase